MKGNTRKSPSPSPSPSPVNTLYKITPPTDVDSVSETWNTVDVAMRQFLHAIRGQLSTVKHTQQPTATADTHTPTALASSCALPSPTTTATTDHNPRITLNVGGTLFVTTEETLLGSERNNSSRAGGGAVSPSRDSFFSAMLQNKEFWRCDRNGEFFIDRSPTVFSYVLDYLRSGSTWLALEDFPAQQRQQLLDELDFYSIPKHKILYKKLNWRTQDVSHHSDVMGFDPSTSTVWKMKNREGQTNHHGIVVLCNGLHGVTHNNTIEWRIRCQGELWNWFIGVSTANATNPVVNWLMVELGHGRLYDKIQDATTSEAIFDPQGNKIGIDVAFLYCRSEAMLTISIGQKSVQRKLHDEVAVDPHICLLVNPESGRGSATVELL